jgi:DNA-binding transcriptional regulator YiaG
MKTKKISQAKKKLKKQSRHLNEPVTLLPSTELTQLREELGMTKSGLAGLLGVSYLTVMNWEKKNPPEAVLILLRLRKYLIEFAHVNGRNDLRENTQLYRFTTIYKEKYDRTK